MVQYVPSSYYYYAPNKVAPIIFSVLFAASGAVHFYQTWHYKSWKITGIMPWAALLLTAGFILREFGAFHYDNLDILIASACLIMSGPPVYALINYMVLSRILYYIPYLSPMHPGRALTTFLAVDGLCELLIATGVQRMLDTQLSAAEQKAGEILTKTALILQACLFVFFICLGLAFQRKAHKAGVLCKKLKTVLTVMYISSVIVSARCAYRIAEFFEGFTGFVYTHEVFMYIFEATIMFINTVMLNIWHPARYLPRSNRVFLAQDGVTELRGPGWQTKRSFLVTAIDPFDIWGLITGNDAKTRFWDLPPEELDRMYDEALQKKHEQMARPRHLWERIIDPLHVFGPAGLILRITDAMDGNEDLESNAERLARRANTVQVRDPDKEV